MRRKAPDEGPPAVAGPGQGLVGGSGSNGTNRGADRGAQRTRRVRSISHVGERMFDHARSIEGSRLRIAGRVRSSILDAMDLGTAANVATTLAVVIGVVFGLAQLRQAVRDRRDHAAVDIVRTVQTQEVRRAVGTILRLPDDVDPDVIRSDPALLDAALAVDSACEMWGSM